ncbi:MAG TPA: OsmC family protein [Actinomycetota bacterium]
MRLDWDGDLRFVGTDSRGVRVAIDAGGREGADPADLLALSLASCLAYDVVTIMRKSRQDMSALLAEIEAERDEGPPGAFRSIGITFVASGPALEPAVMERAIRLARKECPVLASLDPGIEIEVTYRLDEASR